MTPEYLKHGERTSNQGRLKWHRGSRSVPPKVKHLQAGNGVENLASKLVDNNISVIRINNIIIRINNIITGMPSRPIHKVDHKVVSMLAVSPLGGNIRIPAQHLNENYGSFGSPKTSNGSLDYWDTSATSTGRCSASLSS